MLFHGYDIVIIAFFALFIDRLVGEFPFIRHPVILIGDTIKAFEKHFYANSIQRGFILVIVIGLLAVSAGLLIVLLLSNLPSFANLLITSVLASMLLAHRMLHDAVLALLQTDRPQDAVQMLVSRDTADLSESDCYKAGIESYAENLSDGVIAPLFYLLLFGLPGILLYKAINTLDSMVGYRTDRYERFGKASAKLDDILNWLPARITALLLRVVNRKGKLWDFYQQGKLHDSPNAGHPITAMALNLNCQLGGDTVYFGELKKKAWFGEPDATKIITQAHVTLCLAHRSKIDALLYGLLGLTALVVFTLIPIFGNTHV